MLKPMRKTIRKGLTPAKVLDEAFKIVDAQGAQALTMRALASRLGVAPMAIYNHYHDRDAIIDALAERAFDLPPQAAERMVPASTQRRAHWKDRLRTIIGNVQGLAMRHPHVFRLAMTRPTKPGSALRLMSEALAALREGGLADAQAVMVYHTFIILFHGLPFWRETLERYGGGDAPPVGINVTPSPQALKDWALIHGVNAEAQFNLSVEWLLDATTPAKKWPGTPKRCKSS
jgi:AcrR family transcriptional regulator